MRLAAIASATSRLGCTGIDADERRAAAEVGLDHLPGVRVLARRAVALRQPHARARRREPEHGPGVGAGRGDGLAAVEDDVGEEALVALHEAPALRGARGIAWRRA